MKSGRIRLAASAVAATFLAALLVLAIGARRSAGPRPGAQPPGSPPAAVAGTVEFAPTAGGAHTAWLVAGPFDKPLAAPEKAPAAGEGELLSGRPWKLLPWPDPGVEVADKGGLYYASGALVSPAGGRRELRVVSRGPVRIWLEGRLVGGTGADAYRGTHTASLPVELGRGANRLLLECAGAGGRTGFAFFLDEPLSGEDLLLAGSARPATERLALALADASPLRLAALLAGAVSARPAEVWLVAKGPAELRLERTGSAPAITADLELRVLARPDAADLPGQKPLARRIAAGELLAGANVPFPTPAGECLALECTVEFLDPASGRKLARPCSCLFYSRGGLEEEARKLLAGALAARSAPGRRDDALALARLKAEKVLLVLAGLALGEAEARSVLEELSAGREALAAAAKGRDPLAGQVGWLERAYWCAADNSAQPYRLYVPRKLADPAERQGGACPMIVYLHGYVPGYDKHWWVEEDQMGDFCELAERAGAILLLPFGRSNSDFVSIGEVDVLRAIDEAGRLYPVDRARVSICGYSMGGYGAYTVAAHFPDRFSALAVLSGRPVPYYVEVRGRTGQPRYKGCCLDADMPLALAPNLRAIPTRIFHNRGEFIPFESAVAMAGQLKAAGAKVELTELKGDHWSGWSALVSPQTVGWMVSQVRPTRPAKVTVRTFSPRFGRAHWVEIVELDRWTEPAELSVEEDGDGRLKIKAANVREFVLRGLRAADRAEGVFPSDLALTLEKEPGGRAALRGRLKRAPKPGRWTKGPLLAGPMKEACNGPFVVVWGSAGSGEETAANEAKARRFAAEWRSFAKGSPEVLDEKTLTEEEKTARSLIVFGSPATSRLVAEADKLGALECRITATSFEIAGKKASLEGDRGLVLTRPNPWCPAKDRYLVVSAGRYYGDDADHPAMNHKLDLIPDFIVFTAGAEGEGEPPAVLAGYFDSDWCADPALIEVFTPKPPAGNAE